jgi:hypothetical protein
MCTSRTSKPARLRLRPPGPSADRRRSCVSCDSGFVWSTTCDSSPRPKKYSIADEIVFELITLRGVTVSIVLEVHALLRGAAQLQEALAELVAGELGDRAHAAVAEVVDVVDSPRAARSR